MRSASWGVANQAVLAPRRPPGTLTGWPSSFLVLSSIGEEALYLLRTGRSVRLPGLGMLTPNLDMQGNLSVRFVLDRTAMRRSSAGEKLFLGEMTHPEHRHKRPADLIALWNAEHPDDPVED